MVFGDARKRCNHGRRQRPRASDIDIEAVTGGGDLDVERLAGRLQHLGERPRRIKRAAQAGIEDRAILDRDNRVAVGRGKTGAQRAVAIASGMDGDAAAAGAVGIDEVVDFAGDAGMPERIDHDPALPGAIGLGLPVLDGAAAAGAEIPAERRDPLRAGVLDAQQLPALGIADRRFDVDGLAVQRVRYEHGVAAAESDAVAAVADVIDGEAFNHGGRR